MKYFLTLTALLLACLFTSQLVAQCSTNGTDTTCCSPIGWNSSRPDGNAPIGVMGDHYHGAGSLMFSYRFMYMRMEGNRASTDKVADSHIFQNDYMMAPQDMDMQMHMLGAMYGINNRITLMAMTNYLKNEMNMVGMDGTQHFHQSSGLGDTRLSVIAGLWNNDLHAVHLNTGLSIPTGSVTEGEMAHQHHGGQHSEVMVALPYPMQLGSGTWDLQFGGTYLGQTERFSWGAQAMGIFPTGENEAGYRRGNQYQLNSWAAMPINNWISVSVRATGTATEKLIGEDPDMDKMMSPTSDAINFGGEQVNGFIGLNAYVPSGFLKGLRFGIEYGQPLYQNWNGIQMNQNNLLTLGIRYSGH
ncbi:MAG: transporter [Bacteroidota bacterium]